MRYIIELKGMSDEDLKKLVVEKKVQIITSYDPIENLSAKVERLGVALKEFKQSGINWTIFRYYLRGRGLSDTIVNNVMGKVEDFFKEVGLEI